jgi:hypothetical protein
VVESWENESYCFRIPNWQKKKKKKKTHLFFSNFPVTCIKFHRIHLTITTYIPHHLTYQKKPPKCLKNIHFFPFFSNFSLYNTKILLLMGDNDNNNSYALLVALLNSPPTSSANPNSNSANPNSANPGGFEMCELVVSAAGGKFEAAVAHGDPIAARNVRGGEIGFLGVFGGVLGRF